MSTELEQVLLKIANQMEAIEEKFEGVSKHPSQNGGWKSLVSSLDRLTDQMARVEAQVTAIDISLNDPNNGTIAKLNDQIAWRGRVDPILDENRRQDERLLKLEMQINLYNKVTWALGLSTVGLLAKSFMSLILTP